IEPAVSRTCSTTRLITLRPCGVRLAAAAPPATPTAAAPIAVRLATFFIVRLRAAFLAPAARRVDPARFLLVRRFAEALREPARRFEDFFEDFFDDRERFDEDFVERFREEDRLLDAMGFLLFQVFRAD